MSQPACNILFVKSRANISNACHVANYSAVETTCVCNVCNSSRSKAPRRLLDATSNDVVFDSIEAVSVVVGGFQQFAATMTSASNFNSVDALNDVIVVIVAFTVLWLGTALATVVSSFQSNVTEKETQKDERIQGWLTAQTEPQGCKDETGLQEALHLYLNSFFPAVYSDRSTISKLWIKFWLLLILS